VPAERAALVTGGAGYIGSHVVWALADAGWRVVVIDDLSAGRRVTLPEGVRLVVGDVGAPGPLRRLLREERVSAVLHFAGSIVAPESVARPLLYYRNNTASSLALLEACLEAGIESLVFSSTAAVYGDPERVPVAEDAPLRPITPYGRSKLMTEQMLADASAAHGLRYVALRYFNVAGADPAGRTGAATPGASNLIKAVCEAALGIRPGITIFGDDYPTADGTCVRDFIHVADLAHAHARAVEHLAGGGESLTLNCGYGRGFSVREVIAALTRLLGRPLDVVTAGRRPGDPAAVVADNARILARLGWRPRHDDLEQILRDALAGERRLRGLH
jgi:UDP-glucose 4-epimerase